MKDLSDRILYEDENVLVINKPAGLMVHGDGRNKEKTLSDWLIEKYPEIKDVGEPWKVESKNELKTDNLQSTTIFRPGIVHRLDKETSGALVIAKNQGTYEFIKKQFQERKVKKVYRAIVWGELKKESGIIDIPIGRSKKDFRKYVAARGARGKVREAITEYKVLGHLQINFDEKQINTNVSVDHKKISNIGNFIFLEVYPKTGRTHQIRVHMKYLNHPIVCDRLYDPKHPCPILNLSRLALHAFSIEFQLPGGEKKKVKARFPRDLNEFLAEAV